MVILFPGVSFSAEYLKLHCIKMGLFAENTETIPIVINTDKIVSVRPDDSRLGSRAYILTNVCDAWSGCVHYYVTESMDEILSQWDGK